MVWRFIGISCYRLAPPFVGWATCWDVCLGMGGQETVDLLEFSLHNLRTQSRGDVLIR